MSTPTRLAVLALCLLIITPALAYAAAPAPLAPMAGPVGKTPDSDAPKAEAPVETTKKQESLDGPVGILAPCPTAAAPAVLTSGTSVVGTDTTAEDCHYKIEVTNPTGLRLRAEATFSGDHDIHVKFNTPATASPYACSGVGFDFASESCIVATLSAGWYFIRVKRWAGTSDFTLTVHIEPPPPTCSFGAGNGTLIEGAPFSASLTNEAGANCKFEFIQPQPSNDIARFVMVPLAGADFDLYVKRGSMPTLTIYDCRPYLGGAVTETCEVPHDGTPIYAMVVRFSGSGEFTLTVSTVRPCSLGSGDTPLVPGEVATAELLPEPGAACHFVLPATAGYDQAIITMTPATGNFDVYARQGSRPTTGTYGCRSILPGAGETDSCALESDGVRPIYVMIRRVSGSGGFTVVGTPASTCSLGGGTHEIHSGEPRSGTLPSFANAACHFVLDADASVDFVNFRLDGLQGDFDLYVRRGAPPTITVWDCRSWLAGTAPENCDFTNTEAAQYYVMVRRYSGSGTFTLTATAIAPEVLENGVPLAGVVASDAFRYYKVDVPMGATRLTIATVGDVRGPACALADDALPGACDLPGDPETRGASLNLYVRHAHALPTTGEFTCRSAGPGATEACVFDTDLWLANGNPGEPAQVQPFTGAGRHYIGVRGVTAMTDFLIVATWN